MKQLYISIPMAVFFVSQMAAADLRIVSTIPDFAAIAKEIGGDHVKVDSMVRPTQDPHFVDAKPSLMVTLNRADLLLVAGMELEAGWLPPLITGARNRKIGRGAAGYLDCSTLILPMEVQAVDRSKGDIHPGGNPHYWTDPRNGVRLAVGITKKLIETDPSQAALYEQGRDRFIQELEGRITQWKKNLASSEGTKVVVYHDSWVYLLDWVNYVKVGELEPKPGIPPKPAHVAHLIRRVEGRGVRFVIQESFYPTRLSKLFAGKTNAKLLVLPSMVGAAGTKTYFELIDVIVGQLTQ